MTTPPGTSKLDIRLSTQDTYLLDNLPQNANELATRLHRIHTIMYAYRHNYAKATLNTKKLCPRR